jgi:hypothetical protein
MKTFLKIIIAAQLLLLGSFALAQIPNTKYSQGISYITGGVGQSEADAILAEAKEWPVVLELSQIENGRGIWIAGVSIKAMNTKKRLIFDALADGPYMLINFAPGDYVIEADYKGVTQKRILSIKADSSQKISLFWK